MKESKVFLLVFLSIMSVLSLCVVTPQPVRAQVSGIIYIASDGSVYTSTNATVPILRDGDVYTFNGSIFDYSIVVQRDNIIIDGAGYTLQGTGDYAIDLSQRSNVTIRNVLASGGFFYGIYLHESVNNIIAGNVITNVLSGIVIENSSNNNVISANNVTNCGSGISIFSSSNNQLSNNIMSNTYNFAVYGTELSHFVNDVDVSNTISGKKIYYLISNSDLVIEPSAFPDAGFLALVNCTRITVQNLELAKNGQGAVLAFTTGAKLTQNHVTNNDIGIALYSSYSNVVSGNNVTNNIRGVQLSKSSTSNSISANSITNNEDGIFLFGSPANSISGNNITNSNIGIGFSSSLNNIIYNNRFINNRRQVYDSNMDNALVSISMNQWDFGYTLGGNYWNDYNGTDTKSGAGQDHPGSDGIGDTPYVVYGNNRDKYPLMSYGWLPVIYIVSPENKTYGVSNVSLTFTVFNVSKPISWVRYSLDGQANVTLTGNTTLTNLSEGTHSITLYTIDADGKTGTPQTIYFTINTGSQQSAPFPFIWIAVAAVIAVSVAVPLGLVYRRRRKVPSIKQK